ncbi:Crp/Fnr family transcriptional regulator [Mucilaginibacter gossypii]|uniref:cAMP-binding domain of CRP or a regulatory subunit of cAMP-dependent protein kinases n=2 Tax=Sphingobacteriaceae TaxID=84566 RepID=A0A1G7TVT1_9SPHI|nr:Crp/Fnr family transcriptional regulator [Mucilaginibacter gossypii]SDG39134.1 cAMP-binding domain of CRP or a regulatory subunit of cAMP-dependent protein kinases [Mucilaginibacter gossypii]
MTSANKLIFISFRLASTRLYMLYGLYPSYRAYQPITSAALNSYICNMSLSGIFPIDKWEFTTQSVLNTLSEEDYNFLISRQGAQKYQKGEIIFKEGIVPSGIYFIHQGKIKKYKVDRNGREQIIYVANKGELIGYHAILAEERCPDSAAALEDCLISFIPKEDFLTILDRSPLFMRRLLKSLSHEFSVLANSISVISQRTASERLAISLIILREKFKGDGSGEKDVILNISRMDLAGMAGIAQENVIRLLKEFKEEGVLETDGRKIWIKDIKRLVKKSNYGFGNP